MTSAARLARCAVAAALCASLFACASVKLGARERVNSDNGTITASPYPPESTETCRELARENCRYWYHPLRSVHNQCAESVMVQASNAGTNYIFVDEPKESDFDYHKSIPVAIFYRCESLIEG